MPEYGGKSPLIEKAARSQALSASLVFAVAELTLVLAAVGERERPLAIHLVVAKLTHVLDENQVTRALGVPHADPQRRRFSSRVSSCVLSSRLVLDSHFRQRKACRWIEFPLYGHCYWSLS